MSSGLVALTGCIYIGVLVSEFRNGNYGMAIVFGGYAISNLGFVVSMG